jgi:hypothetical protein
MTEQINTVARSINIDEKTLRDVTSYLKVNDHDLFAGYVKILGIEHHDR